MRIWLRWKILLFTVPPLLAVALATLWTVQRTVSAEVRGNIDADLRRASTLFETKLAERAEYLSMAGRVIAEDPRFFSTLTLPASHGDPQFRATVAGVARSFAGITRTDLFEVYDARGRLIASVGPEESDERGRAAVVRPALIGRPATAVLAAPDRHHQVAGTPVVAGGRVVGLLLLGDRIGRRLAEELRELTRSEVTFFTNQVITGTTLDYDEDRAAVLRGLNVVRGRLGSGGSVVEIQTRGQVRLTLFARLPDAGPSGQNYYAMQRSLDAETAFLREIQSRLLELGIFGVIVTLLLGLVISQRITSPIRKLVRGAEEMERGNYEYPLDVDGNDEMAYLAARFDVMRRHQRAYVGSLQEIARQKSEFLSIASHELRTPVSVIRGYNDLLSRGLMGPTTAAQKGALEAVGRAALTLHRIAENATRLAEIEGHQLSLDLDQQDVGAILRSAVETARSEAKGRKVKVILSSQNAGTAVIDGLRMAEAVANLVRNGIRFTPDGGRVEVSAFQGSGVLVIEVADSGIGISEDRVRVLLDPAVMIRESKRHHSSDTLEFNSEGLGLGLAITRGIVEFHGGTIEVESTLGIGSTFRIRIPTGAALGDPQVAEERPPRAALEQEPSLDLVRPGSDAPAEKERPKAPKRSKGVSRPRKLPGTKRRAG